MTTSVTNPLVLDRPYFERQLIVIGDDATVAAIREREAGGVGQSPAGDGRSRLSRLWARLSGVFRSSNDAARRTKRAAAVFFRAREKGINILPVSRAEALAIKFPPGHPRDLVLYVGHPVTPDRYYTMANFHRMAFEHKFTEAVDLLMQLGATSLRVEALLGWNIKFASTLSVPLPIASADASMKSDTALLFVATFPGSSRPSIPEGLVWYQHESTWQSIALGRLRFGLRDFSLTISYEDDFGVNARLNDGASRSGLEIGGKFEDHMKTVWRISGMFSELPPGTSSG